MSSDRPARRSADPQKRPRTQPDAPPDCPTGTAHGGQGSIDTNLALRDLVIQPGVLVGDYRVENVIARGGMGVVYAGVHPLIGKRVAIKVLNAFYARSSEEVGRFVLEARAVNQIGHHNIIDIFAFGQLPDGRSYMVMEYLDGIALHRILAREGRFAPGQALPIYEQLCDALSTAHDKGFVHRDLKPENITVLRRPPYPFIKILDFGIAKLRGIEQTAVGTVLGTPEYMAPEQCRGAAIDARVDIYALGVMLYECVTGHKPFTDPHPLRLMAQHAQQPPRPPSDIAPISAALEQVILKAMAKDREQRHRSTQEFLRELKLAIPETQPWTASLDGPDAPKDGPERSQEGEDTQQAAGTHGGETPQRATLLGTGASPMSGTDKEVTTRHAVETTSATDNAKTPVVLENAPTQEKEHRIAETRDVRVHEDTARILADDVVPSLSDAETVVELTDSSHRSAEKPPRAGTTEVDMVPPGRKSGRPIAFQAIDLTPPPEQTPSPDQYLAVRTEVMVTAPTEARTTATDEITLISGDPNRASIHPEDRESAAVALSDGVESATPTHPTQAPPNRIPPPPVLPDGFIRRPILDERPTDENPTIPTPEPSSALPPSLPPISRNDQIADRSTGPNITNKSTAARPGDNGSNTNTPIIVPLGRSHADSHSDLTGKTAIMEDASKRASSGATPAIRANHELGADQLTYHIPRDAKRRVDLVVVLAGAVIVSMALLLAALLTRL